MNWQPLWALLFLIEIVGLAVTLFCAMRDPRNPICYDSEADRMHSLPRTFLNFLLAAGFFGFIVGVALYGLQSLGEIVAGALLFEARTLLGLPHMLI